MFNSSRENAQEIRSILNSKALLLDARPKNQGLFSIERAFLWGKFGINAKSI